MIAMTIDQIATVVQGTVLGAPDTTVTGPAFVDTRKAEAHGLYVAVRGEHADGHDFAAAALAAGAAAVLSERRLDVPGVAVADTVRALGLLAQHVVSRLTGPAVGSRPSGPAVGSGPSGPAVGSRLTGPAVIAITGSQGKTSCKDIVAQLVQAAGPTVASVASFNNEIGVPLTVLRADASTRFLVVEMGARGLGHIRDLTTMVRPGIGVVLNVGVAHLGEYGSREAIAQAKGELVEALPSSGVAVLNADDTLVRSMRERTDAHVLFFGHGDDADVRLADVRLDDSGHVCLVLSYQGSERQVTVPLVGEHQAGNVAAAVAASLAAGLDFETVCDSLAAISARSAWRMEMATTTSGVTVINDAYNANPDSVRAALVTLADLAQRRGSRRTFAVLGEMRELGDTSAAEHEAAGRLVASLGISQLVAVGEAGAGFHRGATADSSWDGDSVCVPDVSSTVEYLRREARDGDLVLVKGSRAVGLEKVALALLDDVAVVR